MKDKKNRLRSIPAVHEVIDRLESYEEYKPILEKKGLNNRLRDCIRQSLQEAREHILAEDSTGMWRLPLEEFESALWDWLFGKLKKEFAYTTSLRRVVNGTGVVLHTNCGRALLAPKVANFVAEQAMRYSNLELNVDTGERGSRYTHVEELICKLSGAEAAMVVNNNAAGVFLVMNTFAQGKEVIVSRGELVEIGGSFRIPEVLKASGAKLVEVGTTNKTWLRDYVNAIGPDTAMLLKVHTSNYRMEGFTHSVSGQELSELAAEHGIPAVEDLGSGSFLDGSALGFHPEPTIAQSVKAGLSLVTFSGDKLLGGPQAGIIVGKKKYIDQLKKNQLTRALRIDKLTLAGLEATLWMYANDEIEDIPVWRMLYKKESECKVEAEQLCEGIKRKNLKLQVELQPSSSQVGGGAWPTEKLPTWVCAIRPLDGTVQSLEAFCREGRVPILGRIQKDWLLLDPRTLLDGDQEEIINRLSEWQ